MRVDRLLMIALPHPSKGLLYSEGIGPKQMMQERLVPPFVKPPRASIFKHHHLDQPDTCNDVQRIIKSLLQMEKTNLQKRGNGKTLFSDSPITVTQATSVGPKANRFQSGVNDESFHLCQLSFKDHKKFANFGRGFENSMFEYLPTHVNRDMMEAKKLLEWNTLCGVLQAMTNLNGTRNGTLPTHTDFDYDASAAMVLKEGHTCALVDEVVAYFCFPRLGLAVPMCPGDVLVFNSQEPHCLSSRTNKDDVIYGLSIYIKSKNAGMNDDNIPLTGAQLVLKEEFNARNKTN